MKYWLVQGKKFEFIGDAEAAVLSAVGADRLERFLDRKKLAAEIRNTLVDMIPGDQHDYLGVQIEVPGVA